MLTPQFSSFRPRWIDALWLVVLSVYILAGTASVPFHGDESTGLYMSRDYSDQFLRGDASGLTYAPDRDPAAQDLRLINGSIARYTIGLSWHLAGFQPDQINDQWDWGGDWNYNQTSGRIPAAELLLAGRIPSTLLLIGSMVGLFALAGWSGGRLPAYAASLLYTLNPAVLLNGRRAMMEGGMLCFQVLMLLAAALLLRRSTWWSALLFGLSAGLALAAKHTNLFALAAVGLACALYPWLARLAGPAKVRVFGLLALSAVLAGLVFYALNPVWWGQNPAAMSSIIWQKRTDLLTMQAGWEAGYHSDRLAQTAGLFEFGLVNPLQPHEDERFDVWIGDQIAAYDASLWDGLNLGGTTIGGMLMGLLCLVGMVALYRATASRLWLALPLGFWALTLLLTTWWLTPLAWGRYYLPLQPVIALLAGFGLAVIVRWIFARLRPAAQPSPA